ncbi:glycosyltransferase family 2 protein [Burkholderia sp. L27(2015)]|uniref:glycosyltransferase family 2 protein n=1 Tax=Burkholderia sp. L27(2015) TaxID=1641858 RepID=UPI00131E7614|nr:glycosyltransferase [Burkholderia sp. L27(2015)]
MNKKTPVALFAYNRPDHTQRALDALSRSRRVEDCEFHLFADGPRTDAARPAVEATRKVLREWAVSFDARVIEQPQNLGLAKSIATGVSDLCARYGRVIVVEDDLVVNPDFLHYMIESLDRYADDERIMQISGFTLSTPPGITTDAFLLPVTTTWGWATWQRAWQHFAWQPVDLEGAKRDGNWRELFDLGGTCAFSTMLEDRLAGRNDSWGILWWYAVSRLNGLVVYPTKSLVWNGGFDGSGIHCGSDDVLQQGDVLGNLRANLPTSLTFPSETSFEQEHLYHLETFLRSKGEVERPEINDLGRTKQFKNWIHKFTGKLRNALS